jgi:hypothetical protein
MPLKEKEIQCPISAVLRILMHDREYQYFYSTYGANLALATGILLRERFIYLLKTRDWY